MFSDMKPAERKLLEVCQKGEPLPLGKNRPIEKTVDNEIRGEFLRHLILSNNQEIDENSTKYGLKIDPKGLTFQGAYVTGIFDFSFCNTDLPFIFLNSFFQNEIILIDSKIKLLILSGSTITSLIAQRLICDSDIFLKYGFESNGEINFKSAQIVGSLICENGKFLNKDGNTLNCMSTKINGSVSLINGFESKGEVNFVLSQINGALDCTNGKFINEDFIALNCNGSTIRGAVFLKNGFESKGEVDFTSSNIGSLECTGGKFLNEKIALSFNSAKINGMVFFNDGFESNGEIDFISAEILGSLDCGNGKFNSNLSEKALNFEGVRINKSVFLNNNFEANGIIDFGYSQIRNALELSNLNVKGNFILTSAKINIIWIDDNFWEKKDFGNLQLDGLEYNHLSGKSVDSKILLNWFEKMPKEDNFKPQPYKQLAKILRNMGHNEDANSIMIKYNDELRKKDFLTCDRLFISILKWIYGKTAGYGYKPLRVLGTMFIVWFLCSLFYWNASKVAVFAPNNPLVFQKKDCYQCNVNSDGTPLLDFFNYSKYNSSNNWVLNENLDGEYTTFNPFMYSLDVILPIVDLQVEKDWGQYVSLNNGTLNDFTRWLMWFEILFGWIYSLILVAILSGLAKNEKD